MLALSRTNRHTNLGVCVSTFKTLGTSSKWHQEDQEDFGQFPLIIRQFEHTQTPLKVINQPMAGTTKVHCLFQHCILRVPAGGNIQRNRHCIQSIGFPTFAKCFPHQCTAPDRFGNGTDFCKCRLETHRIIINEVRDECTHDEVDNVCKTANMLSIRLPHDVVYQKEGFELFDHSTVVASIMSSDTEKLVGNIISLEDFVNHMGEVGTGVMTLDLYERQ